MPAVLLHEKLWPFASGDWAALLVGAAQARRGLGGFGVAATAGAVTCVAVLDATGQRRRYASTEEGGALS
jgi:hypothetical protein